MRTLFCCLLVLIVAPSAQAKPTPWWTPTGPPKVEPKVAPSSPSRSAAERRAIQTWGWKVGRWWDECDDWWPASQLPTCMRVIHGESRGDPLAHNGVYHGLFQQCQVGVSVDLFKWRNAIRRAYILWEARGWQPWASTA